MSKQRYLDTRFWDDNYIIDKDPIEKLLFIYLLTNPLTNILGIYEISLKRIAFDTGIDREMVLKILKRFEEDDKVKYEKGYIVLKNFTKHQKSNPKIDKGIEVLIQEVPIELVGWINIDWSRFSIDYNSLLKPLNNINVNINVNSNVNVNSNDNDNSQPHSLSTTPKQIQIQKEKHKLIKDNALTVFNYYKKILKHPNAKFTPDKEKKITTRLNEGYSVEDCCLAIDGCSKSEWHMGKNDEHKKYDSIELIFRNGGKIEEFMGYNSIVRNKSPSNKIVPTEEELKQYDDIEEVYNQKGERIK